MTGPQQRLASRVAFRKCRFGKSHSAQVAPGQSMSSRVRLLNRVRLALFLSVKSRRKVAGLNSRANRVRSLNPPLSERESRVSQDGLGSLAQAFLPAG